MVSVSSVAAAQSKPAMLSKIVKKAPLGGFLNAAFCLYDFANVLGAFKSDYDTDGKKVEGMNWKSGLKELGKSAVKIAGYFVVPALLASTVAGAGALVAGAVGLVVIIAPFVLSEIFEKIIPSETDIIAEECSKKGINYDPGFSLFSKQIA